MAPSSFRREHARARRVHGHDFLIDPAAVRRLAADAGGLVYEVGAGGGSVTTELLRRGRASSHTSSTRAWPARCRGMTA